MRRNLTLTSQFTLAFDEIDDKDDMRGVQLTLDEEQIIAAAEATSSGCGGFKSLSAKSTSATNRSNLKRL